MPCDVALQYNPATRRADVVLDRVGFALDRTAATPLIISLGSERRADPDDALPGTADADDAYANSPDGRPNPRRGWPGDALDPNGARIGWRGWLLDDAKQTADTRLAAIDYATEGTAWMADALGLTPTVDASWIRQNTLAILAQAGGLTLTLPMSLV